MCCGEDASCESAWAGGRKKKEPSETKMESHRLLLLVARSLVCSETGSCGSAVLILICSLLFFLFAFFSFVGSSANLLYGRCFILLCFWRLLLR